jgi:predicted metal-dependent hydrolase
MWRVVRVRRRRKASKASTTLYETHKEAARALVHARLAHFAELYQVSFKRVAIRNSRSRWGSCSAKGNLNFNYRLVLLPPHLVDYVVVHEVCHLKHFNHSPDFWAEVARTCPEWKRLRRELRTVKL